MLRYGRRDASGDEREHGRWRGPVGLAAMRMLAMGEGRIGNLEGRKRRMEWRVVIAGPASWFALRSSREKQSGECSRGLEAADAHRGRRRGHSYASWLP